MGVRESINRNPKLWAAVAGVAVTACILAVVLAGRRSSANSSIARSMFFTQDDGATWTAGDVAQFAGGSASTPGLSRVRVFKCPKDNKEFVGYLERLNGSLAGVKQIPVSALMNPMPTMVEVKKQGGKQWVSGVSPQGQQIVRVACPVDGTAATEVLP